MWLYYSGSDSTNCISVDTSESGLNVECSSVAICESGSSASSSSAVSVSRPVAISPPSAGDNQSARHTHFFGESGVSLIRLLLMSYQHLECH